MARWHLFTLVLIVAALLLWAVLLGFNLGPGLMRGLPAGLAQPPADMRLQAPLSRLPAWASSVELFITMFLAGVASLFLFPRRMRNMTRALGPGWSRLAATTLLGIGCGLLLVLFGIGAALARITFAFTVLAGMALVFVSAWGFLAAAYGLGRFLLLRAGWARRSPPLDLALGLLLLLPLIRIPLAGGVFMILYVGLGLGLAIATRFGSNESWSLIPLLEEVNE